MKNITKRFGNIVANDKIDLIVKQNTIHGILGENGAGKSTLMSILFGLYNPDEGEIFINGKLSEIKNPLDAEKVGIGMVHQHFKLVDRFDAVDNIILGAEPINKFGLVDKKKAKKEIKKLATQYNFEVNLDVPVSKLSVGQQQKIEILKTLYRKSDILIFDEPTAVLTPVEIDGFLKLLLDFKKNGKTIIIITHKLDEIKEVCDEATVIRRGKFIERFSVAKTSTKQMSTLMVGKEVEEVKNNSKAKIGRKVIEIKNLHVKKRGITKLDKFNLTISEGEIVAIAGVEGNGQSEIINAISGLDTHYDGTIEYLTSKKVLVNKNQEKKNVEQLKVEISKLAKNKTKTKKDEAKLNDLNNKLAVLEEMLASPVHKNKNGKEFRFKYSSIKLKRVSIAKRYKLGISHIPEDRHLHGLVLDEKVENNLFIQQYSKKPFSYFGILNTRAIRKNAKHIIEKFDVRGANGGLAITRGLSGGNQQKAIVGRELTRDHKFIIIAQPTRGLDVGAINQIHKYIIDEKEKGRAVLLLSYELSEVLALADRVVVINKGRITGEIDGKKANRENVGLLMTGATEAKEAKKRVVRKTTTKKGDK